MVSRVLKGNLTFFFFFGRFQWNFNSISAVSRFFGVQKLKLKVVSLKPRVSTEKEGRWFHWNQGFRLRRRLGGFIETKGFDWDGGRRPSSQSNTLGFNEYHPTSFSVEYLWFQWNPPALLLSRIPLVSMKCTFIFQFLIPPKIVKPQIYC